MYCFLKVWPDSMVWTRSNPIMLRAWRVSVLGSQACVQHFHSRGSDSEPSSVWRHHSFCLPPGAGRATIPDLSTQLHGHKFLLIVRLDGGMEPCQGLYSIHYAGTGSILVGVVLFKASLLWLMLWIPCESIPSTHHNPPCGVHCRVQTDTTRYLSGRAHLLITDWLKFISPKVPSVGMFVANRWRLLSYPMPFAMCFCAPGVWSLHAQCFLKWCLEILLRLTPQFLPSSTCRYSRRCFLIARLLGTIFWSMSRSFVLDFKQAVVQYD